MDKFTTLPICAWKVRDKEGKIKGKIREKISPPLDPVTLSAYGWGPPVMGVRQGASFQGCMPGYSVVSHKTRKSTSTHKLTLSNVINSHISQNHRITESQNGRGWKGPLWVIQSNPPAKAG